MAIPISAGLVPGLLGGMLAAGLPLAPMAAAAAPAMPGGLSPNQPLAIEAKPGLSPPPCRLVVPGSEAVLQPLRIHPSQVARKNGMGCLSAADALYGPDGCPSQLCGRQRGYQVPLPDLNGP